MYTSSILFGDPSLHRQLCLVTEVLTYFLANRPRYLHVSKLLKQLKHGEREVRSLCARLEEYGLLIRDSDKDGAWRMSVAREGPTLWDVYSFVIAEHAFGKSAADAEVEDGSLTERVGLVWMQAALATNQRLTDNLKQIMLLQIVRGWEARSSGCFSRQDWMFNELTRS